MSVRLALASFWVPGFLKRRRLRELVRQTAEVFGVPKPDLGGRSYRECLRAFASLTAEQAEAASRGEGSEPERVRARLRARAYELGRDIRGELGVRTRGEGMRAARLVYGMLGIDFEGGTDGSIVIRTCAFSGAYSPTACALVSGLDEGLLAGLAGEGRLEFAARITEGRDRCEATFHFEDGA